MRGKTVGTVFVVQPFELCHSFLNASTTLSLD
jgi:hypothetical protein